MGSLHGPPTSLSIVFLHLHPHSAGPQPRQKPLPTTQSTRRLVAVRATPTRSAGEKPSSARHGHGASRLGGRRSRHPLTALSPPFVRHQPRLASSRCGLRRIPGPVPPQPAWPGYAGAEGRLLPRGARGGSAGRRVRRGRPRRRGGDAEEVRRHRSAHQRHGARGLRALRRRPAGAHCRASGTGARRRVPRLPPPRTFPSVTDARVTCFQYSVKTNMIFLKKKNEHDTTL